MDSISTAPLSQNESKEIKIELSPSQRAKIEVNRQKAKLIRMEKINKRQMYSLPQKEENKRKVIRVNDTKLIDTGSGFFIEEEENDEPKPVKITRDPPPLMEDDQPFCEECILPFDSSYLKKNFSLDVCDECRDEEDKHSLITKTDAKNNYLLKDVDFDRRPPPLKFIVRKNPHNNRWGDMKLYLKLEVEKRALVVWETEEALEEAMQSRLDKRDDLKKKKFQKKMKELRMSVRSSLYTRASKSHVHDYAEEVYHSEDDEYSQTCCSCGHSFKYDKM